MAYVILTQMLNSRGLNYDLRDMIVQYTGLEQNEIDYRALDVIDEVNVFQHMEVSTTWADYARERGIAGWVRAYFYIHDWMWACTRFIHTFDPEEYDNYPDSYIEGFNDWSYLTGKIEEIVGKKNTHEFWQLCLAELAR